ncbi:MAG: PH domain-containing protein [Candidatus Magasanikbacteria bacterium]|nr:PH domain-containing protein [Candidatus Magasanikbacteria bacterium]
MRLNLLENEKIILVIRRYGLTYFWQGFLIFILIIAPFFFMFWLFSHGWWGILLFSASLALALLLLIRALYFWHRNAFVITNQKVIDIYQVGSLEKTVTEVHLDKIHNVSYKIKGLFPTIFHYGKIKIQTVGGEVDLEFDRVKNPAKVQEVVSAVLQNRQQPKNDSSAGIVSVEEK